MAENKKSTPKKTGKSREEPAVKKKPSKKTAKASVPKRVSRKKEPQTMEELLALNKNQIRGLKRGDVLKGSITEKSRRALFIDINAKTEGVVFDRELKEARDLVRELKVGDEVTATVVQPENDSGQIILSLKKTALDRAWRFFEEKLETGDSFVVQGREINRGGLIVNARGLQGFVPSSQFSRELSNQIGTLVGKGIEVKVIEVDWEKNRLIFSERAISEADMLAAQKKILGKIKIGDILEGKITAVMPFGFFVKVSFNSEENKEENFLEGLVHISEISWQRVDEVAKFGKVGDEVKVKVLAIDEKSGKLNLSIKQLIDDPWNEIDKKYPKEKNVKGKISRITPFGAFVLLEPGIEGLIHISKIPAGIDPRVGDEIDCFVNMIDPENRRMSLGVVLTTKPVGYK
ncbi:MAG: S1 RNA-binding domain-containing protein [Candidatus Pacebacteria bacterium]|nr:S1 RNA-binding domain-containing protein [Candidatus Paceibacterota bacterium]